MGLFLLAIFGFNIFAQSTAANPPKFFDCANLQVQAVNFKFCAMDDVVDDPLRPITEKEKNISFLDNNKFKKYNNCSVSTLENGIPFQYFDINQKDKVCAPPRRMSSFCESPEHFVTPIGPLCNGLTELKENCSFVFQRAFSLGNVDLYDVHLDSRYTCQCNSRGCGHVVDGFEKENKSEFTPQELANYTQAIRNAFANVAPGCNDVRVADVSISHARKALFAMSSQKCSIQYAHDPVDELDCPYNSYSVERIWLKDNGRKIVIAIVCLPDKSYSGPGSNSGLPDFGESAARKNSPAR